MIELAELEPVTLADGVENSLLQYIRQSGLAPGDPLPKEELLADRLDYMGLVPVHMGYAKRAMHFRPNLYLASDMQLAYEEAAQKLLQALSSPADFLGEKAEPKFQGRKRLANRALKLAAVTGIPAWEESLVLERRGLLRYESYADYLRDPARGDREN